MKSSFGVREGDVLMDVLEYVWVGSYGVFDDFCDRLIGGIGVREGEVF
jgi:hypothetical protein